MTTPLQPRPKIGRHLRPVDALPGFCKFEIYSFTRAGHEHEHLITIGLRDQSVHCTCEHFCNRFAQHYPTLSDNGRHCKHVTRALAYLRRHEQLPALDARPCVSCPSQAAEHGLADEFGRPVENKFICMDCVRRARMMHDEPAVELPAETSPFLGVEDGDEQYDDLDESEEEDEFIPWGERYGMMGQPCEVGP